jgi:hypothetical protein
MNLRDLHEEFPRDRIEWRPQGSVSKNGSILALAYIDARDVMDRLDAVCGPENWQDSFVETPKGRVVCTLSILVGERWVSKSDGAGETQVEGDKGAISDALKRAAVKWGVGRYLYSIKSPWVPCDTYPGNDGKPKFKRFTVDPWSLVRGMTPPPQQPVTIEDQRQSFRDSLDHDPETGEVRADHDDMAEDGDPPSVKDFMAVIREMAGPGATREQLEQRYAAEVIANVAKRKSSERARRWFAIFCDLHEGAIGRIQDQNLRSTVRSAIALKQAQINGEKPDEADFGYPFGEPIVMGDVRVAG